MTRFYRHNIGPFTRYDLALFVALLVLLALDRWTYPEAWTW